MTVAEYVNVVVDRLANCRDSDQFQTVLDEAVKSLAESSISKEHRELFWAQVKAAYKRAPKIVQKEAAAAEKLFVLMQAAEAMLASAATK